MRQQQEDAEKIAILKNGAERGELVNTLEEELQKTLTLSCLGNYMLDASGDTSAAAKWRNAVHLWLQVQSA